MNRHPWSVDYRWQGPCAPFRRLTADQARRYDEEGYLLVGGALDLHQREALIVESDAGRDGAVRALAERPELRELACDLLGAGARFHYHEINYKQPNGRIYGWHQDNGKAFFEPQHRAIFWFALDDTDEENGCIWIAPGLHRQGTLAHVRTQWGLSCFHETSPDARALPMRAGDLLLWSGTTPQYSGPNRASTPRRACILEFPPEGKRYVGSGGEVLQG